MKLPVRLDQGGLQSRWSNDIAKRQTDSGSLSTKTKGVIIFSVTVGFFLCGGLVLIFVLRYLRGRHANPKYLPGSWLKSKWRAWIPSSEKKRYSSSLQDRRSTHTGRAASPSIVGFGALGASANDSTGVPDRNTSVRSTITLPAYTASARPTEQILGREGERAGIDTVVEFPETVDEEEERRDQEMESLYQIRRARREERLEREERRQMRREARARNDRATLESLRLVPLDSNSGPSAALIEQHQNRDRGRRISTVNYLDLGLARHDGSRVRAQSNDSNRSLLGGAARMGGANDSTQLLGPHPLGSNFGNNSTSSLRYMTADYSDDEMGSDIDATGTPRRSPTPSSSRLRPTEPESPGERQPPEYDELPLERTTSNLPREPEAAAQPLEEPPSYSSPLRTGAPPLPTLTTVPSIEITPTPWSPVRAS